MAPYKLAQSKREVVWIRQLIWTYFWLLIFEGALRKWVMPFAASLLLLIRDPIVIAAYFLALRRGFFPRNMFVATAGLLGVLSLIAGLLVLGGNISVVLYGFRSNFLQLPFIFLIPKVFDRRDVQHLGTLFLLLAIPMAFLMLLQFRSAPDSWINSGITGNFGQLTAAGDKIRPPGTFSFITGPILFFSVVTSFICYSQIVSGIYPRWLTFSAIVSTLIAAAVSASRSLYVGIGIVLIFGLVSSFILKPKQAFRLVASLVSIAVIFVALSQFSFFKEGLAISGGRVESANNAESFTGRALGTLTNSIPLLLEVPLFGYGLGLGTNVGAALLTGLTGSSATFLLAEEEWPRIVMESGPILGGFFIIYRIVLTFWLGWCGLVHMRRGNPLSLLLFSACASNILNGQFGAATGLGFAIFTSGICLAAMRHPQPLKAKSAPHSTQRALAFSALPLHPSA